MIENSELDFYGIFLIQFPVNYCMFNNGQLAAVNAFHLKLAI
jgi:hypothetical protein